MKRMIVLAALALTIGLPQHTHAQYIQNDIFSFEALNQNMWGGSGPGSVTYEEFLGVSWNANLPIDLMAGGQRICIWPFPCFTVPETGVYFNAHTDGRLGLDVGATLNMGSVDVTMPGQATVSTAALTGHTTGSTFTIGTGYAVDPFANMHTQFPSLELYADFVFDVNASAYWEACFVGGCDDGVLDFFDINWTPELFSFNRDASGELRILGGVVPMEFDIGPVTGRLNVPNLETDALAASTSLQSSGDVNVLEFGVDIPPLVADAILPGSGYLFNGSFGDIGYSVLSTSLGPRFGIGQEFDFTSTPMTTLSFSEPVAPIVSGVALDPVTSFDAPLGSYLDFVFPDAMTVDVTPTYWLDNTLNVDTDFLSRLGFNVSILEAWWDPWFHLGPLWQQDFQTIPVAIGIDDRTFSLAFDTYQGSTFALSRGGGGPAVIPEPSTWILMGSGLLMLGVFGWRRKQFEGNLE